MSTQYVNVLTVKNCAHKKTDYKIRPQVRFKINIYVCTHTHTLKPSCDNI